MIIPIGHTHLYALGYSHTASRMLRMMVQISEPSRGWA